MNKMTRFVFIILALIYVVAPDFFPGPIDDILVLLIACTAGEDPTKMISKSE